MTTWPTDPRVILTPLIIPEPPRDSGEADAVHGLTALGTHHDNTHTQGEVGPGTRP